MPRGKRTPAAEQIEREREALELRRSGQTYDRIAEQLVFSNRGAAYKAVQRALGRTLAEPAAELRAIEADRLDRLHKVAWDLALKGDLAAIDRVLRIADRRAKLLGLDVTASRRASTTDVDAEIDALLEEIETVDGAGPGADHPG